MEAVQDARGAIARAETFVAQEWNAIGDQRSRAVCMCLLAIAHALSELGAEVTA